MYRYFEIAPDAMTEHFFAGPSGRYTLSLFEQRRIRERIRLRKRYHRLKDDPVFRNARLKSRKKYAHNHPDKYMEMARKKTMTFRLKQFGLTLNDYEQMLVAQNHCCAICKSLTPGRLAPRRRKEVTSWPARRDAKVYWIIDHDHETNAVRALLCHQCNTTLGFAKDDPDLLITMAEYLRQFKKR